MSKRITILGAGESGTGAALLAKAKGYDVFVSDKGIIKENFKDELRAYKIVFEEGFHTEERVLEADLIIKSPGIPDTAELVGKAIKNGIQVISELEFAFKYTSKKIIAITGTNGKTTTTLLVHHLLQTAGVNATLAGNIGYSLARQVILDDSEVYVVEVSSFQLDGMFDFKADVAILLNITPDHLNRYDFKIENYVYSKLKVAQNMKANDLLIYSADDENIQKYLQTKNAAYSSCAVSINENSTEAYLSDKELNLIHNGKTKRYPIGKLPLKGPHNYINMLAAIRAVMAFGLSQERIANGLASFKNFPHRMEHLGSIKGVQFVNDSKATNVEAVYYALNSYNVPITWIAGGVDKGNDYDKISKIVSQKVKALICLGEDNDALKSYFGGIVQVIKETKDIKEAAQMALEYSEKNDVVLLSPACASFDLFKSYEHRGNAFKQAVVELKSQVL